MNNKKDSEIAWISIQDKINKEWNINNAKKEEDKRIEDPFKKKVKKENVNKKEIKDIEDRNGF